LAINTVEREWYIDGPVSDGVPIPSVQVVIQPVLTFFKPITAPASVDRYMTAEQAAEYIAVHAETLRKWA
jgi:hypothetical protein